MGLIAKESLMFYAPNGRAAAYELRSYDGSAGLILMVFDNHDVQARAVENIAFLHEQLRRARGGEAKFILIIAEVHLADSPPGSFVAYYRLEHTAQEIKPGTRGERFIPERYNLEAISWQQCRDLCEDDQLPVWRGDLESIRREIRLAILRDANERFPGCDLDDAVDSNAEPLPEVRTGLDLRSYVLRRLQVFEVELGDPYDPQDHRALVIKRLRADVFALSCALDGVVLGRHVKAIEDEHLKRLHLHKH